MRKHLSVLLSVLNISFYILQVALLVATIGMGFSIFVDHTVSYKPTAKEEEVFIQKSVSVVSLPFVSGSNNVDDTIIDDTTSETPIEIENIVEDTASQQPQQPQLLSEEDRYNYLGIRYDQQYPINISFFTDITGEPIPVVFNPLIPTNDIPETFFEAGSGYTMVYADPLGNVSVIPHSGFYLVSLDDNTVIEVGYEANGLREFIEGGNSQDTTVGFEEGEVRRRIESIKYATMSQNEVTVPMSITAIALISAERLPEKPTVEPQGIASLIGVTLDRPSIVIVTCAWRWDTEFRYLDDSYASKERIIVVLQPQT